MTAIHILAFVAMLVSSTAFADADVTIYVEDEGRIIELFENCVDELFKVPPGQ